MHIKINKNYLTYNSCKVKCAVGKNGIGYKKNEGDLITPIGKFKVKFILYRKDRIKKLKTKLKKFVISKNMGWCDDPKSTNYNKLVRLPFNYGYEKLFLRENIYDIILVLNYNMAPVKKKKGSAIFIHIANKNYKKTHGCVAVSKVSLLKIIKNLKKGSKIMIGSQI